MSDKKHNNYAELIDHLDIDPSSFLMIGNSMKSDIIPVLDLGGYAIYVPYHTTWEYENVSETPIGNPKFFTVKNITNVLEIINNPLK